MGRKGFDRTWFRFAKMAAENKESIITVSALIYAGIYLLLGIGGISFQAQPAASSYHNPPDAPSNPDPADGEIISSDSVTVSAEYNDDDGIDGQIRFWNESDGTLIDSCSVSDGNRCGVPWGMYDHGENDWYAEAIHSGGSANSSDWTLIKNQQPQLTEFIRPSEGVMVAGNDTELEVRVEDENSGDQLKVSFFNNGSGGEAIENLSLVDAGTGSGTAEFTWPSSKLDRGENEWWHVVVHDPWESNQSLENTSFYVNQLPSIRNIEPPNEGFSDEDPTELVVDVDDKEQSNPDKLKTYFYGEGNFLDVKTGFGVKEYNWTDLGYWNEYSWKVKTSDGLENNTKSYTFLKVLDTRRAVPRFDYRYSTLITSAGKPATLFVSIVNSLDSSRTVKVEVSGSGATFPRTGTDTVTGLEIPAESERRLEIRVNPSEPGYSSVTVKTIDDELNINSTESIPVYATEFSSGVAGKEIPGIQVLQILVIAFISTLFYYLQL